MGAALLVSVPPDVLAADGPTEAGAVHQPSMEVPVTVGRHRVQVHIRTREDERGLVDGVVEVIDPRRRDRVLFSRAIPPFFFRQDAPPSFDVQVESVRGFSDILRVRADVVDPREGQATWEVVVLPPDAPTPRRGRWEQLWSSRRSALDVGEQLEIIDPADDGRDRILVRLSHPSIAVCGRPEIPLAPRIFDPRTGQFRAAAVQVRVPSSAPLLEATEDDAFADHLRSDSALRWVSSNDRTALYPGHGRAPDTLSDGLANTGWVEGGPGPGAGHFITGEVIDGLRTIGITLHAGIGDTHPAPSRLLFTVEDGRVFELRPDAGRTRTWRLPHDVDTRCFSLVIVDGPDAPPGAGIALFRVHTHIDRYSARSALENHLLPLLFERIGTPEERAYARLVGEIGVVGLSTLMEALEAADERERAALVRPISDIPGGKERLTVWLGQSDPGRATLRAFARVAGGSEINPTHVLIPELLAAPTAEARSRLLQILSRAIDPERAFVFIPYLGHEDIVVRDAARLGLSRAGPQAVDTLLVLAGVHDGRIRRELLRTIIEIRRRDARGLPILSAEAIDGLRDALGDTDGTIARLAIQATGRLAVLDLAPDIADVLSNDPHPFLRAEAARSAGLWLRQRGHSDPTLLVGALQLALDDPDPTVRLASARAVLHGRQQATVAAQLQDRLDVEEWPEIRRALIQALVTLADPEIDLRVVRGVAPRSEGETRTAIRAFQSRTGLVRADAIEHLSSAWESSTGVQLALVQLAARNGGDDVHPWLRGRLDRTTTDPRVFHAALDAAARRRMPEAQSMVHALLDDDDPTLRRFAARASARLEDEETLYRLLSRRDRESDPRVLNAIDAAIEALRTGSEIRDLVEEAMEEFLDR